ncbi:MAG TPA: hypothetical protein VIF14_11910 [Alphaproteobacteria bacterium]|jgi:hypothetical protein
MFRRLALILGLVIAAAGSVGTIATAAHAGGPSGGVIGDRRP